MKYLFSFVIFITTLNLSYSINPIQKNIDTLQTKEIKEYHSRLLNLGIDINSCKCLSCRAGNPPLFLQPKYLEKQEKIIFKRTKRKNFVVSLGYNLYSKLENHPSLNIGVILYDHLYVGADLSPEHLYPKIKIYMSEIDLYLSVKRSILSNKEIFSGGIGYELFLNKNISINPEIAFYTYDKEWTERSYSYDPSDGMFGSFNLTSSRDYHESHVGSLLSIRLQIHF